MAFGRRPSVQTSPQQPTKKSLITPRGLAKAFMLGVAADMCFNHGRVGATILTNVPNDNVQLAGHAYRGISEMATGGVGQMALIGKTIFTGISEYGKSFTP